MKNKLFLTIAAASLLASAAAFAETAPSNTSTAGAEKRGGSMFENVDTNKDGDLSQDEFLSRHVKRFETLDKNGDGKITKEEFLEAHAKKFTDIDTNHDGKVAKEELKASREAMKTKIKEAKDAKNAAKSKQTDATAPSEKKK